MRSFIIWLGILAITFTDIGHLSAQNGGTTIGDLLGQERLNTISTAVPFLLIAPDARSGALGDAGVASSPDANSMHWNPAKFAFVQDQVGLSMNYTPWLRALVPDINLSYLGGYYRLDDIQVIGFSLVYFSLGEIFFTDEVGTMLYPVRPNEFSVSAAYSRKLGDHISGSVTARYIHSDLTQGLDQQGITKPGRALAADVAAYYERELNWNRTPGTFAAGINISNIGNKISYTDEINADFIPINLRIGPRLTLDLDDFNQFSFMVDLNKLLVPTPPIYLRDSLGRVVIDPLSGDYVIDRGRDPNRSVVGGMFGSFTDAPGGWREELNEITYSLGIEYWYDKQFAIRAGYFHEHETKGNRKYFTLGVGLKYNVFGLDFAYVVPVAQRSPLENVLRFSLHFDFAALGRD